MSSDLHGWIRTWQDLGRPAADEGLYRRLYTCWSEPHRRYHSTQHLHECMQNFDAVRGLAIEPGEVALGLWFHDAFYDAQRSDNETRSADWAAQSVRQSGLDEDVAGRVHALVMATLHTAAPEGPDAQLLVDIDLSILGAEAARFDESNRQIREEYAHVPEEQFRIGRRRVLTGFLGRPRLYSTEHFHSQLETRARSNLQRALDRLGA
ncbi:MAG: N-methyl-D-aspartate receptor NMDAR2C subunit [Pseudomonadota bacterium]